MIPGYVSADPASLELLLGTMRASRDRAHRLACAELDPDARFSLAAAALDLAVATHRLARLIATEIDTPPDVLAMIETAGRLAS